jgi:protoheme IX farnesyltransferase
MLYMKPYLTLCRVWISLFAACSAATGFFLGPYHRAMDVLIPAAAVFLLACGASALNQYQERHIDAKMERTQKRPLPSGAMTPVRAIIVSASMMIGGLLLAAAAGPISVLLGLGALLWYNGIYTGLKRVTAFAAIPGAAVGMIPPAIGWVASGGGLLDPRIAAICFLFFLWQVPHFWLLILKHGAEYERAGLPSLTRVMSKEQLARITSAWITASAVASFALPLYGPGRTVPIYYLLIALALWLIWSGKSLTEKESFPQLSSLLFKKINIYLFVMMSLLTLESIFSRLQ